MLALKATSSRNAKRNHFIEPEEVFLWDHSHNRDIIAMAWTI